MKKFLPVLVAGSLVFFTAELSWAQQHLTGMYPVGQSPLTRTTRSAVAAATASELVASGHLAQSRTLAAWASVAGLAQSRGQHAAVVLNNKIYVWGGYVGTADTTPNEFNSLEIYDAATNTWGAGAPAPSVIRGHAHAVGADGQLYSMGGANNSGIVSSSYRYNPNTNVWVPLAAMPIGQWEAAAATASNGRIYVFGGTSDNALTQIYTPSTNTWASGAAMPVGRHGHAAVRDASGLIHIIGGIADFGGTPLASHIVYNPTTNIWATAAPLPSGVNQPGGTLGTDGNIYITGGKANYLNNTGPFYNSVYVYNAATNSWTSGTSLPITLAETRSVTIGSDIYTIAGANGSMQSVVYRSSTATTYTWNGSASTSWTEGANWSGGVVPTATDNVIIPAGLARYPIVTSAVPTAQTVTVNSGASLTVNDGGTLTVTGNFVNNGTFNAAGNASVALTGSAAQSVGGGSITQFRNLSVGAAGASLSGQVEIQRLLTLTGNLATNSQRFLILSNHTGSAMVFNNGGVVNGSTVVQRYIDVASNAGFGYRHFSPAVSGATLSNLAIFPILPGAQAPGPLQINADYNTAAQPGLVTPYPTVFAYNQNRVGTVTGSSGFNQGWQSPEADSQPLTSAVGLTINEPAGNFFELTGPALTNGPITRNGLTRSAEGDGGWHLVGNPYPSPIDWNRVGRTNVEAAAYVYRSLSRYEGGYTASVNGVGTNLLPMGQAFFVRASTPSASGTVSFTNAARETSYLDPGYARPATQTETRPLVQLTVQRQGATGPASQDAFYVYEQSGATSGFDAEYDAVKVQLNGGQQPSVYQVVSNEGLAIQGLPTGTGPRSLALGVQAVVAGSYSFSAEQVLNLPAGEPLWLEDQLSNTWQDLRQGAYTVALGAGLSTSRFVLHLHQARVLASGGAAPAWAGELQLYPNPASAAAPVTLVASGVAGATAELILVNSIGQPVWRRQQAVAGKEVRAMVPVAGLAKGIYTLQVRGQAGVLTRKLVVQ